MSLDEILEQTVNKDYDTDALLKQYILYVEMANDISNRRENTNRLYVTLLSTIIGLISLLLKLECDLLILILPLILIIIISSLWKSHITEYKKLNSAKFKVINHLENFLPAKGFSQEWKLLKLNSYKGLTKWDKYGPIIFIIVSSISLILLVGYELIPDSTIQTIVTFIF